MLIYGTPACPFRSWVHLEGVISLWGHPASRHPSRGDLATDGLASVALRGLGS